MTEPIKSASIVIALGASAYEVAVLENWPLVFSALEAHGIAEIPTQIAAIATVAVETGRFSPIKEKGGPAYFTKLYEGRKDLGNFKEGDGPLFRGRGYIQITGRANYTEYGRELGEDLAANPDLALDASIAAHILALYFKNKGIPALAAAGKWETVRRRVNGGLNGWARFLEVVTALQQVVALSQVGNTAVASAEQKPVDPSATPGTVGDVQV
jgi:hypothetical protein